MCKEELVSEEATPEAALDTAADSQPENNNNVVETPPEMDAVEATDKSALEGEPTASQTDALAEVNQTLSALRELFERQIARNQNQTKMFDAIYREMKDYKESFLLEALHNDVLCHLSGTGEERPVARVRAVRLCIRFQHRRRVDLRVDGDRNEMYGVAAIREILLHPRHRGGEDRADARARREDEVRDPYLAEEILRSKGQLVLVGEHEVRNRSEVRQLLLRTTSEKRRRQDGRECGGNPLNRRGHPIMIPAM